MSAPWKKADHQQASVDRARRARDARERSRGRIALLSEFQPDAVEIEERPPPRIARLTLYAVTALIGSAVAWACVSVVDEIAVAPGKLVTTGSNLVVQPLETSVIRSLEVGVGDIVHPGQTLARLDATFTQADVEQLQTKIETLDSRIDRLEAELGGRSYTAGSNARPDEVLQARQFAQRKAFFESQIRNFDEQIRRAAANLATGKNEEAVLKQRLGTLREIETMRTTLLESKSGSLLNYLQSRDTRLDIEANLARITGGLIETQHGIEKAKAERQSFIEEFRRQALDQLVEARDQRKGASEELKKASLRQRMVMMTAPAEAVVLDIASRSIGSVVREAEPLFTLVPLNVPIEVEATIDAKDIGRIGVDQAVRIKFDSFPFQKHGTASGIVRTISQDAFSPDTKNDRAGKSGLPFYRARIQLTDTNLRALPPTFRLIPGLTVVAEIKSGQRSVISYFLYPLLRGLDESIREP